MNAGASGWWSRAARCFAIVLSILAELAPGSGPLTGQSYAAAHLPGAFAIVTVDGTTWQPYDYGSAFFYDSSGDAYTASHVVAEAATNPGLRLVAIVDGAQYIARPVCWNPASPDSTNTFNRDVAIVHVGPEVPLFPIGRYPPAGRRLTAVPLRIQPGPVARAGQSVRIVGFGDHRTGPVFVQRSRRGRIVRIERLRDGTVILRIQFTPGAAPASGDSGGPILNAQGAVIGIANWRRTHPLIPGTAEMDGVGAASLGCVVRVPPERDRLDPSNTPLRQP